MQASLTATHLPGCQPNWRPTGYWGEGSPSLYINTHTLSLSLSLCHSLRVWIVPCSSCTYQRSTSRLGSSAPHLLSPHSTGAQPNRCIPIPSHTTCAHCPFQGLVLVACCDDGSLVEANSPLEGDYDTSKTFYLEPLPCCLQTFVSIKDRLRVSPCHAIINVSVRGFCSG